LVIGCCLLHSLDLTLLLPCSQLTGLWVFYENQDDQVVHKKVAGGEQPFVDPHLAQRSVIEGRLVDIMEQCWETDPLKRIDIFQVVQLLRQAAVSELNPVFV
jgi:hypothetical protein